MEKLYIYLARRDKKGIKTLLVTNGSCLPTKLTDLKTLGLSWDAQAELERITHENRMHWELYVESATSYENLKQALLKRGYTNLPIADGPSIRTEHLSNVSIPGDMLKTLPGQKVMMKRGSNGRTQSFM